MDLLNMLGDAIGWAVGAVMVLFETWLVATATRRVLGVRVGWVRAFVVSLVMLLGLFEVSRWLLETNQFRIDMDAYAGPVMLVLGLILLWGFALGAMVLVVLEVIVPTGSVPPLRRLLLGWGHRWRRGRRYARFTAIAARHGLGAQLRGLGLRGRDPADASATAAALRRALDEAGVTFVKLGQMLSTRADLLPEPFVRELARLQTAADPLPWSAVASALEGELGRPISAVFAAVDETPLASASVGQVHAATLLDGRAVVVKVQRPGAQTQVELDVEILLRMARTLERNAPWARRLGVLGLAQGFAASLAEELDYRVELDNMAALRRSLAARGVRIPWVAKQLCTPRLIVMERFDGTPVSRSGELLARLSSEQRQTGARTLLTAVLGQITGDGIFHADLHGGNVVLWPDGSVGLLDFGAVGRLDAASRRQLGLLLWAIDGDDPALATDAVLELLDRPDALDERALQRSLGELITRFRDGLGAAGSVEVFSELFRLVVAYGFRVPPAVAAALRSLGALEGTLTILDPELDLVAAARETGREVMGEVSPERVRAELTTRLLHLLPLVETLPRRIGKISEDLERGRFTAHVRVFSDAGDRAFLSRLVQQLVVAVLAGSAVLGGIVLAVSAGGPALLPGLTLFTFAGYLLAFAGFVLGLRSVALVFGAPSWEE